MEVPFSLRMTRALSGSSETGAQVADHVDGLGSARLFAVLLLINSVVRILQVPVVDQRHDDSQSIQLARAGKRIVTPLPGTHLLLALCVSLEPHIGYGTIGRKKLLTALQARRHLFRPKV